MVELKRVCEVYTGSARCGSGYLVTDRLVLTAGHAVGPAGSEVHVRCAATGAVLLDGTVVWRQYGGETDEALLEITDPRWVTPPDLAPVRWGRLVTSKGGVACEAAGFPDAQLRRSGAVVVMRDLAHLTGTINPLDGAKWGILQISVASAAPDPAGPGASLWGGMSGAAVLCGPLLTGIITRDADRYGGRLLNVVPVDRLLRTPGFLALLAAALGQEPVAEPAELEPFAAAVVPPYTPAALLRADVEAVGFRGRQELLDEFRVWCVAPGGYSVRLLTGPGGQGKTRLACELGRRMAAENWAVLRLAAVPADGPADYGVLGTLRATIPVLVIVDYAEARSGQVGAVVEALTQGSAPARLLLLARTAGEWQRELVAASPALDLAGPEFPVEVALPPLADGAAERAAVFADTVTDLSARLGALPGHAGVDWEQASAGVAVPDLSPPRYGTALAVQMTALAALLTSGHGAEGPSGRPEDVLLGHEERYWGALATRRALKLADPARMHRWLVAAGSLCTAADEEEAVAMLARLPGLADPRDEQARLAAARWLHDLYPERNLYCGSLQPDVLAEWLVGNVLADKPTVFDTVLTDATTDQKHHGLTVLSRAAASRPEVARAITRMITSWPAALAPAAVRVASETENPAPLTGALDGLLASDALDADLLDALSEEMPGHSEIHGERAEQITARLVRARRQRDRALRGRQPLRYILRPHRCTPESENLSAALYHHAHRLGEVGRAEDSLAAYRESIAILRRLAKADPDVIGAVAVAVNDMTQALAALGRHREALAASDQAIADLARAAHLDREALDFLLAMAGLNRGKSLMELRRLEEALAATEDSRSRLRALPSERAIEHALALSAMNMAAILTFLGRAKEAVIAAREAVDVFRDLAGSLPDQFMGNLAMALINTSRVEGDAGDLTAALAAAGEAVTILRGLSEGHPEVFGPFLAMALMNQGAMARTAQPGNGRVALEEAVTLFRGLAAARPAAHNPQLAMALIDLAAVEMDLNHATRAQELAAEALTLAQVLAEENPEAFEETLLLALDLRAAVLGGPGQAEEAIAGTREAVAVWRQQAGRRPATYEPRLAMALARLAQALDSPDQAVEAHDVAAEAVALCRRIAPSPHWETLGLAVAVLSATLTRLGRHEEALAASTEAVRIYRAQAAANPGAYRSELAKSLSFRNSDLAQVGRLEEALTAGRESIELYQALVAEQPGLFESDLADELSGAAYQLGQLGRMTEAVERAREVVAVRRTIAEHGTDEDRARLARSLHTLSFRLDRADQAAEALTAQQESAWTYRDLAGTDPGTYDAAFATALTELADSYFTTGDFIAAAAAVEEAVPLLRRLAQADPATHRAALAAALKDLGAYASELGRPDQALAAAKEARTLFEDAGPGTDREDLTMTMMLMTEALVGLNRMDQALSSAQETLALLRAPALDDRAADGDTGDNAMLAMATRLQGLALAGLGRTEEAIAATQQTTDMMRALAQADSTDRQATLQLALSLQNLGKHLTEAGRHEEALAATSEALTLLRQLSGSGLSHLSPYIAMCLNNQSLHHLALQHWDQATAAGDQAVTAYRALIVPGADGYQPTLAMALRNLGISHREAGRGPQALAALRESVAIYERLTADNPADPRMTDRLADAREQLSEALDEFA
jgi:tetratricopeptide (TPR) repeat protein